MRDGWREWRWGLCLAVLAQMDVQAATQDCPSIVSPLKRLECFDLAAGTPIHQAPAPTRAVGQVLPIVDLVQRTEAKRPPEDQRFLLSSFPEPDNDQQHRLVISAPALGALPPRPYLAISCESKITRLQLVLDEPALYHDHAVACGPGALTRQQWLAQLGRPVKSILQGRV